MTIFSKQNVDLITFHLISEKTNISSFGIALNQKRALRKVCSFYHKILPDKKTSWSFIKNRTKKFHFLQEFLLIVMHHTNLWPSYVVIPRGVCVIDCYAAISAKVWSLGTLRWWQNQEYHRKKQLGELIHIHQGRKRIYEALVVAAGRCSTTQEKQSTSLITFDYISPKMDDEG